ncbi:MAG: bifunctional demethylmenaquinone methyltransferase/2-methoxy-6-polyprenyl-1,4-benzoquinol methylase UbiE [Rikenellaceae bacterium]|nr:bifunctional demethylmenaquinone methyltransferase/2-methoxy-6-polyprenyl-1,4-benzoquinol methylase UbiE [Rikenellaceae bacterium]
MKPYSDTEDKKPQVEQMFDRIAPVYDLLNHTLSFNIDRLWRRRLVRMAAAAAPRDVLDVATGTGDLALMLARRIDGATVTGVDLSAQMLAVGRDKIAAKGLADRVRLVQGDAERLPFDDASFDAVTAAFGVRNFQDIPAGIGEMARVLRPGGTMLVLEFTMPRNKIFAAVYRFYFHRILPAVGGLLSRDRKAYRYLPSSVEEFAGACDLLEVMRAAGLGGCTRHPLMGGVAQIWRGVKG